MLRIFTAVSIISFALMSGASAQEAAASKQNGERYTAAQLKQLVHSAHTSEQYQVLANYYAERERNFLQQAAQEKIEWQRRSQNLTGILAKYPRPADSAKYMYESYVYRASEAGSLSAKYRQDAEEARLKSAPQHM